MEVKKKSFLAKRILCVYYTLPYFIGHGKPYSSEDKNSITFSPKNIYNPYHNMCDQNRKNSNDHDMP